MLKYRYLLNASMIAALGLSYPALAQDLEETQERSYLGNEIIVTAQRREETLAEIPLSIQAFSQQQLEASGIEDLPDLQFTTPGYVADVNNGFTQIFIRGIGNAVFIGADPSVATFIDDVPQIYGVMIDKLPDVERVEILKGAQGGLYGRNATGGVVNVVSRRPDTSNWSFDFKGSYGGFETVDVSAFVNAAISDKVALSIAAQREVHDAYVKNYAPNVPYNAGNFPSGAFLPVPNGTEPIPVGGTNVYAYGPAETAAFFNAPQEPVPQGQRDFWATRLKLLIKPTDNLSVTFSGAYARKDDNSSGEYFSTTPRFFESALRGLYSSLGVDAVIPDGFIQGNSRGKWTTEVGHRNYSGIEDYSIAGTIEWDVPGVTLKSITAYRNMKTHTEGDNGVTTVSFVPFNIDFDREYFYQELRAVSNLDGPFSYTVGASYLDNRLNGDSAFYLLSESIPIGSTTVEQKIRNMSAYAEVGYDLTDRLNLTVSGRYIREKNEADFTRPIVSGTSSVQSKFVPSATIRYELPTGGNVYARWARGFKTGGVNILTAPAFFPNPQTDGGIFGPETVDSFEVGFKTYLFDRAVQVTGAVFYNDYRDLQIDTRPQPAYPEITLALINAESARTYGVEGSLNWQIDPAFSIGVNGGYLNARYKDFKLQGSEVLGGFDLSGEQMPKAPEFQFSANASLDMPITDDLNFAATLLASYTDSIIFKYSALPGVLPNVVAPDFWLVNGRIGIRTSDDRIGLYVSANNLFDKVYYTGSDAGTFGNMLGYGTRRIIKGEIEFHF